jgi:hypothetical protein
MIDLIAFLIVISLFFMLIVKYVRVSIKLSQTTLELIKAHVDKTLISEKLSDLAEQPKDTSDQSAEAFLKFISDSRDWAYAYIEEVQTSLTKFVSDVEPEFVYFDTYGDTMAAKPNYDSMKKISGAYKELKKLLPEDYGRIEE